MIIAISKGTGNSKYKRYAPWLASAGQGVETVELSSCTDAQAVAQIRSVDGILFTGGEDIHPKRYDKTELVQFCEEFDEERDERELQWFALAREYNIPILGICRGMQLMNVALGGSLIAHLVTADMHRDVTSDVEHAIVAEPDSMLASIVGTTKGQVNSAHHQAIDRLAAPLRVASRADDGTIEAVEWLEPAGKPFFLGLQWHPERMEHDRFFSQAIACAFLSSTKHSRGNV